MADLAPEILAELHSMLRSQATGSFTMHIERGVIKAWEAKRLGKVSPMPIAEALQKARA